MKSTARFLCLLLIALSLPLFARAANTTTILLPGSITATGGQGDVDISGRSLQGVFALLAKSSAGTNPTADVKLQTSDPAALGENYETAGTTVNKLRAGATTAVQFDATFTQSGAASVKTVALNLEYVGTITAGQVLTLTIQTDSAGSPSGTILGTAGTVDINTLIPTAAYGYVPFAFAVPVDLADATVYHLVLSGAYTASTSNYVSWRSNTVGSGGNQLTYNGTTWTAVTTQSFEHYVMAYSFADITGGAFTQVTTTGSAQTRSLWIDSLKSFVRTYVTIGGTSNPAYYLGLVLVTPDA